MANKAPDSNADTGVGASEWASGSQVWTGKKPTLVPNPRTANK